MNDYLLRHAIDNVWCNLGMDRQFQYELRQLTPRYGTRRYYTIDGDRYDLPFENERDWFHVYQIGQVVPSHLALPKTYNQWISLESLASEHKMLGEVYVDSGVQFSRSHTWVQLTQHQNLLVCQSGPGAWTRSRPVPRRELCPRRPAGTRPSAR